MAKKGKLDMQFVVDTSKPSKNIKELQTRIEKLRDTIEGAPLGSAEFEQLTGQLSNASSEMKVLEKNMEGLEPQQKAEAFLKMGEGIAGAFAVGQGAMALMGVESENMEKLQVKVQSAIAIATGIRMMSEAALMAGIAKRVIVEKLAMAQTKAGILLAKGMAVGQALWAVGQGVLTGSIAATTIGLHALKAAIMATGIGALALLIIGLVVAVVSYVGSTSSATTAQDKLNKSVERGRKELAKHTEQVIALAESYSDSLQTQYDIADAETEAEKTLIRRNITLQERKDKLGELVEINKKDLEQMQHRIDTGSGELKYLRDRITETNNLIEAQKESVKLQWDYVRVQETVIEDEKKQDADREASRSRGRARSNQKKADAESLRKLENELLLLEIEDLEERAQLKREQDLADELAAAGEIRDKTIRLETLANIQDIYDQEELNRLKKLEDDKLKIITDKQKEIQDGLDEAAKELTKSQIEATDAYLEEIRIKNLENRDREIEDANKHFDEMMLAEGLTGDEKMQLLIDHQENIKAINKVYDDEELAVEDEKLAAKIETLTSSLSAISANMDARVSELDNAMNRELEMEGLTETQKEDIQEKFQKKKDAIAKRQKAISASQAVIDTYVSATAAYKSMVGIPVVGPVLAPVAAGAAIAMGLANVRQIYAQDVGGGGGGGGGGVSGVTGEEVSAPKTGSFTLSGETDPQDTIKAYVVTDDMTDSQSQLEDIREDSTI